MPKLYTTGTINQPDAGSLGLAMHDKIRDDVVAHVAWELVEEFSPGTLEWIVLRCLAAQSGLPADFYASIGRRLSDGVLYFLISEAYNDATNVISKMARRGSSSSTIVYDADGCAPETFTLASTAPTTSTGQPGWSFWTPSGTSTKWWIIVDNDRFVVAMNGASNGFTVLGAFTPLADLAFPMPLLVMGNNDNDSWMTRSPAVAGLTAYAGAGVVGAGGGSTVASSGVPLGFQGTWRYNDKLQNNQRPVAEQGITVQTVPGVADYMNVTGWAVGKQKGMRISNQSMPVGMAFGDAFVLSGTLWVPWKPDDGRIFDTGVPSS